MFPCRFDFSRAVRGKEGLINITDYIPTGAKNAVSLRYLIYMTGLSGRKVRKEIERSRKTECICNFQNGKGYFMAETVEEAERFKRQEMKRYMSIWKALRGTRKFIEDHSDDPG